MAYNKTTWADGDVITAEKLNNIESELETLSSGSSSDCNLLVVNATATKNGNKWSVEADTNWTDIDDAYKAGKIVILKGVINPNDGSPEAYYRRAEFLITNYSPDSQAIFSFVDLSWVSTTVNITRWAFIINFYAGWSFIEKTETISN